MNSSTGQNKEAETASEQTLLFGWKGEEHIELRTTPSSILWAPL